MLEPFGVRRDAVEIVECCWGGAGLNGFVFGLSVHRAVSFVTEILKPSTEAPDCRGMGA